MKLRTVEDLFDFLSSDIAWRKKELSSLRILLESTASSKNDQKQRLLLRSGVTMLYAHWEGFVKTAALAYLEFVAMRHLPYNKLTDNFIALSIRSMLNEAKKSDRSMAVTTLVNFFLTRLSENSKIPYKQSINTDSNLSSNVFKEIVHILNFDYSLYATKEKLLDEGLLKQRNEIAHGQYLTIKEDIYISLYDEVLAMMEMFMNQIDNSAYTQAYLR